MGHLLHKRKIRVLLLVIALCSLTIYLFVRSVKHYPIWWWFMPYERFLCDRNATLLRPQNINLRCYYVERQTLYRYRIEELHSEPDLIFIRQFIYNLSEIEWMINFTREYSLASPVYTLLTNTMTEKNLMKVLDFRTSNSIGFDYFHVKSLYDTAERVSGLTVNNLDGWLDVVWYRKYGHIIPHHDVYPNSDTVEGGRRFATLIVYLLDPEEGGATIFPNLEIAVKPNAGDAILWYNTKVDNEPDSLLSHAGCPVWKGEKFIGTFWFRQFHQEARKPCPVNGHRFRFS